MVAVFGLLSRDVLDDVLLESGNNGWDNVVCTTGDVNGLWRLLWGTSAAWLDLGTVGGVAGGVMVLEPWPEKEGTMVEETCLPEQAVYAAGAGASQRPRESTSRYL